ncbi:hypothetical protein [Methylomonas sp. MgM2]
MIEIISALQKTPLPTILIFAGIFFLILSVSGDIAGKIRVPLERQKLAGIIGFCLLLIGVSLNFPAELTKPWLSETEKQNNSKENARIEDNDKKRNLLSQAKAWSPIGVETFVDNNNGWVVGKYEDDNSTVFREINSGRYRWQANFKKSWMTWDAPVFDPASDFFFAVDVKLVNGPRNNIGMGFLFRRTQDNYYYYKITDTQFFSLYSRQENQWKTLIPWTFVKSVKPGLYNRIGVIAQGPELHLFINDIEVGYFEDSTNYNGNVILTIESTEDSEAVVDFDNIEFRRPD